MLQEKIFRHRIVTRLLILLIPWNLTTSCNSILRRKCEAFQIKSQACTFPYCSGIKNFSSCELEVGLYGLREGSSDRVLRFLQIVKMNEGSRNEELEGMKTLHQTKSSVWLPLNRKLFSETQGLVILFLPRTPLTPFTYCF